MSFSKLRMSGIRIAGAAALLAALSGNATGTAIDHHAAVESYFLEHVRNWVTSPEVIEAVRAQNLSTANWSQDAIDAADKAWRSEMGSDANHRPRVQAVMDRDISAFLLARQRDAHWMIVEVIVMDAKGLNVGLSTPSSDYWQGDEAKFQETFGRGTDALHIDAVEYEADTRLLISQVNQAIIDPETGKPIGAVTVSINMNKL